ncbi:MAG: cytochrome c maturation protein CcmE [Calditrichaeota bacterium]|nr:MAG: cytochrome c maturation protein CcmE [Calditrichota bacterium]MBL1206918.1 cytochrome c maturation protein CcmE [Calditrichota bacterium]NOG46745.1 cytochrome c maturation protein CcmE [Calditrichota bacterium]
MKTKYIIGTVIIVAFAFLAISSFEGTITPYVSIAEAIESGESVQVKGQRVGDANFDIEENLFKFTLKDEAGKQIDVIYDGAKPGNFDQAIEVVCQGSFKNGKFHATNILVKCPSKYEEEGAHPESIPTKESQV